MPRSTSPMEHFDERLYLEQNPDVLQAVRDGRILSGFEHYILVGHRENRPGMPPDALVAAEQYIGHPAPPTQLRFRVHGDDVLLNFIAFGQVIGIHIDERSIKDGLVDTGAMMPIARAGYQEYFVTTAEARFFVKFSAAHKSRIDGERDE